MKYSQIVWEYKGYSFCIEPSGKEVQVVDKHGIVGKYGSFDDMMLNQKIDGKPLIELLKDLEYGDCGSTFVKYAPPKNNGSQRAVVFIQAAGLAYHRRKALASP